MKHKHAEVIKAWADGAIIERRVVSNDTWEVAENPNWIENQQYRVKPEPDYPTTSFDGDTLHDLFYSVGDNIKQGLVRIANAAIKQAIIDGSVILPSNANK